MFGSKGLSSGIIVERVRGDCRPDAYSWGAEGSEHPRRRSRVRGGSAGPGRAHPVCRLDDPQLAEQRNGQSLGLPGGRVASLVHVRNPTPTLCGSGVMCVTLSGPWGVRGTCEQR